MLNNDILEIVYLNECWYTIDALIWYTWDAFLYKYYDILLVHQCHTRNDFWMSVVISPIQYCYVVLINK